MEEAKVIIQDKVARIPPLRQVITQPPLQFFPTPKLTRVSNPVPDHLRLSLGGIYSTQKNPLTRSSSIAVEMVNSEKNFSSPKSHLSLPRASSLPVQMGGRTKRVLNMKELRFMRRVVAKKRAEAKKHRNAMKGTEVGSASNSRAIGVESSDRLVPKLEISPEAETENTSKRAKVSTEGGSTQDDWMTMMERMPSVTVTGDGPNGRKVNGFLYRYDNRRDVTIVCVCHGQFLTMEEFAQHAGCIDVTNPQKKIFVTQSSFYY